MYRRSKCIIDVEARRVLLQEASETAFRLCYEKTVGHGNRLDLIFQMIRIGLFFNDLDLTTRNLEKARRLVWMSIVGYHVGLNYDTSLQSRGRRRRLGSS